MFKAMILLKKKDGMTNKSFADWWLGDHAKMASKLPKIKKLCFNLVEGDEIYDGIAEQWFEKKQDFLDAYASDYGKKVASDSLANVGERVRLFVEENNVV